MDQPRFFVGIGAQRSGTTWLCHYLRRVPEVSFSPIKEICFFDSKYLPERHIKLTNRVNTRLAVLGLGKYTALRPLSGLRLWYNYLGIRRLSEASYRAYFDELARHGRIAGEITPVYSRLGKAAIRHMDEVLEKPKYFFIMRNPVDRLLSEFSFRNTRPGLTRTPEGRDLSERLMLLADESLNLDYADCITRYESIVGPDRLMLMFTEDLFTPGRTQAMCDALCKYLGVPAVPAKPEMRVNSAPAVEISEVVRRQVALRLADQYRFAESRMGDALPDAWRADIARIM